MVPVVPLLAPTTMDGYSTTFTLVEHVRRCATRLRCVVRLLSLRVVGATLIGPITRTFRLDSDGCHLERFIRYWVTSFDLPIPNQGRRCAPRHPPSLMAIVGIREPTFQGDIVHAVIVATESDMPANDWVSEAGISTV